jgi:hypothetical protein
VHDEEEAEERDGAGEVEVFEREADARREQLRQHPGQARVHPQERLLRIHPPCRGPAPAPAVPQTLTRPGLSSFPSLMEASIRLGLNYSGGGGEWIEKGIRSAVGEICPVGMCVRVSVSLSLPLSLWCTGSGRHCTALGFFLGKRATGRTQNFCCRHVGSAPWFVAAG